MAQLNTDWLNTNELKSRPISRLFKHLVPKQLCEAQAFISPTSSFYDCTHTELIRTVLSITIFCTFSHVNWRVSHKECDFSISY